ncbi:hypothetical protein GCM10010964_01400 [Caldovatus sediminis]|uniref:GH16 domain-containing protein n=1 Tax=Caldovatus sediminis TaxID=2041189 RepID=A0A8J3EAU2_9PROT|nr:family 16 glycosylhydrolase [Caldovatus sediminis]GGG16831.1 hypothetical protein GCM10010964_01400 [Caldovatus sediminis]
MTATRLRATDGADSFAFAAGDGRAVITNFEVGVDSLASGPYGAVVREVIRADGVPVTIYRYGWGDDVVRLPGVSGVTREQLEQPGGAPPAAPADPGTGGAVPPGPGGAFRTVFYDGFDVDGDLSRWKAIMQGPHHSGMWWNPDGVKVRDGELEVSADLQDNGYYTGAGLAIDFGPDAFGVDYGRIEVRAKWDAAQGIAPAIMGWPSAADAWPPEFDLMEVVDADGQWVATTNHWQGPGGNGDDAYRTAWTEIDSTDWHTYAVQWTPEGVVYTIDGEVVYTGGPEELPGQKMTASIGVFVGTWATQGWVPLPDETTPEHVGLHVDYVKVEEWIGG